MCMHKVSCRVCISKHSSDAFAGQDELRKKGALSVSPRESGRAGNEWPKSGTCLC
jgi:hypothetical protein